MFPILQVGPLALQLPGLFLLLGVWVGTTLIDKEARRNKLPTDVLNNMVFFALLAGIIGARLGHALQFLDLYISRPTNLLSLNPSTFSLFEGLLAGLVIALIYGQRRDLPLWRTLDTLTPSFALFMIFLGLARLSSGDGFGAPTELPWGIELWGTIRHPTQVYDTLAAGLIFVWVQRTKGSTPFPGFLILMWSALSAVARLILEAFRGDSSLILGGLREPQLFSLGILVLVMIGLQRLATRNRSSQRHSKGVS